MLGYDVLYLNDAEDARLTETAAEENRVLLTSDKELFRNASIRGVEAYLVMGRTEAEKLAELAEHFRVRLEIDITSSRCPKCNTAIRAVSKEEISGMVPESTSRFYSDFWICPNCSQIYWQGSHWKKIGNTLGRAKQIVEAAKSAENAGGE